MLIETAKIEQGFMERFFELNRAQINIYVNGKLRARTSPAQINPLNNIAKFNQRFRLRDVPQDAEIVMVIMSKSRLGLFGKEVGRVVVYLGDLIYENQINKPLRIGFPRDGWTVDARFGFHPNKH
jgi:hypothetical protein